VGLLHFTGLEGGISGEREEKPKGGFRGRRGGLGGVNRRIVEGLYGIVDGLYEIVEGLCGIVEGLCKGWK
jgi:hypothetical protein